MMDKKILIDLNHAFDVHFFKNLYKELINKGFNVKVIASQKPMSFELLEELDIPHSKIGSYGTTLFSKAVNLVWLDFKMLFMVLKFRPQLMLGHISFRAAHIGWLLNINNIIFTDTDHALEQIRLYKTFAQRIITPISFIGNLGKKHERINSIFELAYLHPHYFLPNINILQNLNLRKTKPIFLLRFVSWDATHDKGEEGLSAEDKSALISFLNEKGRVFISSEYELTKEYEKYRINLSPLKLHHLLAFSTVYIGEGGTMASEAAVLGVPSIFSSTISLGYIEELETKWELLKRTTDLEEILLFVQTIMDDPNTKKIWKLKKERMLKTLLSPTKEILNMVEEEFQVLF